MDFGTNPDALARSFSDTDPTVPASADTTIRSFQDLLAAIAHFTDLPPSARRAMDTHLRTCARVIAHNSAMGHAEVGLVPCNLPHIQAWLFRAPAAAFRITPRTFENYVSGLRSALRRVGILPPESGAKAPTDPVWQALLARLNSTFAVHGLTAFAAWCDARGLGPGDVTSQQIKEFEAHVAATMLVPDIHKKIGNLTKTWRRMVKLGWVVEGETVTAPDRRAAYTLPFAAYPQSLQDDVAAFAARLSRSAGRGPYRHDGPAKPLAASTVKARLFSLRQALAALVLSGRQPETIATLADLITETAFETVLTFYWERAIALKQARGEIAPGEVTDSDAGVTAQTGAIATALLMVAKYHLKLPAGQLQPLKEMADDLRPAMQSSINPKTRKILNALAVPTTRLKLLNLPFTLMREAETLREARPREAGRVAMVATAIAIELMLPLRIGNLTCLHMGEHLRRQNPRSKLFTQLTLPAGLVKNRIDLEWPIDEDTATLIDTFVNDFRPLLAGSSGPWLFPSGHGDKDHERSIDSLRAGITGAIEENVGIQMHVHAFRAFVAMLVLEDNQNAREDLRLLLGHKTLVTADRYYAHIQPLLVAKRVTGLIDRARKGLSLAFKVGTDRPVAGRDPIKGGRTPR